MKESETFEEWLSSQPWMDDPRTNGAEEGWHARDAEIREKDERIAALEVQLAEARKDSERLNSLFKHDYREMRSTPDNWRLTLFQMVYLAGSSLWTGAYDGKTPREAIDAAIEAVGKEGE